jgi:sarcosine oxidase subunit gamma
MSALEMNMSAVEFKRRGRCGRLGLKGPRAAEWLEARGIALPAAPNRWIAAASGAPNATAPIGTGVRAVADAGADDAMLVARLGTMEFFLEDCTAGERLRGLEPALEAGHPGVYPVLREDAAFSLSGPGSYDVLAQVCNVNFAGLELASQPIIMTLMIGVAVLVVPQMVGAWPRFRIWCDPTFGPYLEASLATVVTESGGNYRRQI